MQTPTGVGAGTDSGRGDGASFSRANVLKAFDIAGVNPQFGNPFVRAAENNCASCAAAVWRRLNGIELDAAASLRTDGTLGSIALDTGMTFHRCSWSEIESYLKGQGPGANMIAAITRCGGQAGHAFNVVYDGGEVYVLDGQTCETHGFPHDYGDMAEVYGFF